MDRIEEEISLQQCLLCKRLKRDRDAIYTSSGEMICSKCLEWWNRDKEHIG